MTTEITRRPLRSAVVVGRIQSERVSGLIHALHECRFAAADVLSHRDTGSTGRGNHNQVHERVDRVGLAFGQRDGHGIAAVTGLDRDIVADFDRRIPGQRAFFQLLIDNVSGQHLGHAGGYASDITLVFVQTFPGLCIHDEGRSGFDVQCARRWGETENQHQTGQHARQPSPQSIAFFVSSLIPAFFALLKQNIYLLYKRLR